jgi:hypothetical protein
VLTLTAGVFNLVDMWSCHFSLHWLSHKKTTLSVYTRYFSVIISILKPLQPRSSKHLLLYSQFKSEKLKIQHYIKLTFHKMLIMPGVTCVCSVSTLLLKLQSLQNKVISLVHGAHLPRFTRGLPNSVRVWFHSIIMQVASRGTKLWQKCFDWEKPNTDNRRGLNLYLVCKAWTDAMSCVYRTT